MTERPAPFTDLDWDASRARALGEAVVDLWAEYLERLPSLPVDRGLRVDPVHEAVVIDIPEAPMEMEDLLGYLRELVFEQSMYPGHPGFMAYVSGSGTVPGAAADLVAAFLNQNLGGWRLAPGASEIELALTRWLAARFGMPEGSGGILQSGGAMANFISLKAARDAQAGYEVRDKGVRDLPPMTIYCSDETHVVIVRAADMLGLGADQVRRIPVDAAGRLPVAEVRRAIESDLASGFKPIAIVGTAGTTSTGAIDPLDDLADLAEEFGLWFHVDAAYGGPAILADELKPLFAGVERADSIVMDPHKWLYTPHSGGCALLRDASHLSRSFGAMAAYIHEDKEFTQRGLDLGQLSPQFSRGFHALKVWVSLLAHGTEAYGKRIAHDVHLTRYLAARVEEHPELELMAPVTLSICCFRYVPADLPDGVDHRDYLNRLNERLMPLAQTQGQVYYSNAILDGTFCQRACIVNHRTEAEHMDQVVDVTVEIGRKLHEEMTSAIK